MTTTNFLEIDGARLWDTLEASGRIGQLGETGLRRMALTDEDGEMRDLFVRWCRDAGCAVEIDEVGNIFARRPGEDESRPPVAIGSHLDTQIFGGKYDGILGVLTGLEVIRTLNDRNIQTRSPLTLIAWSDEEGARFSHSMMGSSAFAGIYPVEKVLGALDPDGKRFGDELRRIGYAGTRKVDGHALDSYFELHIEQGPTLDAEGIDVGIVTGSYFVRGFNIEITGDTAHVGPTPMDRRRNALVGAGYLTAAVNDIGWKYHPEDGKTTVSRVECESTWRARTRRANGSRDRYGDRGGFAASQCRDGDQGNLALRL
jgi:beta-ureidopropionase / N-carbamoyl-L-amino-acid hydrolase